MTNTTMLPENPAIAYRGCGWAGWAKLLGTERQGKIDDSILSVYMALIPALDGDIKLELEMEVGIQAKKSDMISNMPEHSKEWHTLILRDALAATENDENTWWENNLILQTLKKIDRRSV